MKNLTNSGCQMPQQLDRNNSRVLFAKPICTSYEQAINLLKSRNLGPGDIAVVRYYLNTTNTEWNDPTGLPIRMVMGIGGANAPGESNDDLYIFNDNRIDGGDYITTDEVEQIILNYLSDYVNKEDLNKILNSDKEWKELVNSTFDAINTRFNDNDNEHVNFSRDIDEIRNDIKNISNVDLSKYYTKDEIHNLFVTKEYLLNELNSKIDASYVENYFKNNVESTVNTIIEDINIPKIVSDEIKNQDIPNQVSIAVDEKLKDFDGLTTETLDDALKSNEYFINNVINPIESVSERVNTIESIIENIKPDIDGEELDEWI